MKTLLNIVLFVSACISVILCISACGAIMATITGGHIRPESVNFIYYVPAWAALSVLMTMFFYHLAKTLKELDDYNEELQEFTANQAHKIHTLETSAKLTATNIVNHINTEFKQAKEIADFKVSFKALSDNYDTLGKVKASLKAKLAASKCVIGLAQGYADMISKENDITKAILAEVSEKNIIKAVAKYNAKADECDQVKVGKVEEVG